MTTYRLRSVPGMHVPVLLTWLQTLFKTRPSLAANVLQAGFKDIPRAHLVALLAGRIIYTVEDGTVVFQVDEIISEEEETEQGLCDD